jgi:hypothetical protein
MVVGLGGGCIWQHVPPGSLGLLYKFFNLLACVCNKR